MKFISSILHTALKEELLDLTNSLKSSDAPIGSYIYATTELYDAPKYHLSEAYREYETYEDDDGYEVESDEYRTNFSAYQIRDMFGNIIMAHKVLKIAGSLELVIN